MSLPMVSGTLMLMVLLTIRSPIAQMMVWRSGRASSSSLRIDDVVSLVGISDASFFFSCGLEDGGCGTGSAGGAAGAEEGVGEAGGGGAWRRTGPECSRRRATAARMAEGAAGDDAAIEGVVGHRADAQAMPDVIELYDLDELGGV